jgi:hypothetical protein
MDANGHGPETEAIETVVVAVARTVWDADFEEGDTPFDDLSPDDKAAMIGCADDHVTAHITWLQANGFRLLMPGALPRPHSEAEALAMVQAAKDWFDAKKRKPGLLGGIAPKRLFLPPGSKM